MADRSRPPLRSRRQWRWLSSIRFRATAGAALAALIVFGSGGVLIRTSVAGASERQALAQAKRDAEQLAITLPLGRSALGRDCAFMIVDSAGKMWWRNLDMNGSGPIVGDFASPAPPDQQESEVRVITVRRGELVPAEHRRPGEEPDRRGRRWAIAVAVTPVLSDEQITNLLNQSAEDPTSYTDPPEFTIPAQRLTVFVVPQDDAATARELVDRWAIWTMPITTLFVALVAWYTTGRALRPVEAIRARMAAITLSGPARGSALRVPVPAAGDELTSLANTTNATLERLQHALGEQRRLVADASHELRSPLANLRSSWEIALAHPERADWPAVATAALADTTRLQKLTDDLLLLSRVDHGTPQPRVADSALVDLSGLVSEQFAERVHLDRAGIAFSAHASGPVLVAGRESDFDRVLRNLLDNAARHARTRVHAAVVAQTGTAVLTVTDDGPGIPEADRERVFDRFVRLDDARGRADGGSGLGLAIVRALVTQAGGAVHISHRSTFVVTLPLAGTVE
jgi:signal transduction histidine kinase